jgi:hypothetical protein
VGLFDRIILTIYTFSLTFISFITVATALGWLVPLEFVWTSLHTTNGRWVFGLIGGVFFVVSIRLLYFAFRRTSTSRMLIHDTALGQVDITFGAIENLVERVGHHLDGIRDIRPTVAANDDGISVKLVIGVSPDTNVPQLADELQNNIKRYVRRVVGLPVTNVDVHVRDITTQFSRSRLE